MENTLRSTIPSELGAALRHARQARGLSLRAAAPRAYISAGHLCNIEHGFRAPSAFVAAMLVDVLGLPTDITEELMRFAVYGAGHDRSDA